MPHFRTSAGFLKFISHPGQKHFIKLQFIVNTSKLIQGRIKVKSIQKVPESQGI